MQEVVHESEKLIQTLRDTIKFLRTQLEKLQRENELLRNAVYQIADDFEPTYRQMQKRFKSLEKIILRIIIDLIKQFKRPVTYEDIIRAFRARYGIPAKTETITRTVRKLKEQGIIFSPKKGYFMISRTVKSGK